MPAVSSRGRGKKKLLLALVGLPARGKVSACCDFLGFDSWCGAALLSFIPEPPSPLILQSYIANKLKNYMNWRGVPTRLFNVGKYRRMAVKDTQQDASFFDSSNSGNKGKRDQVAMLALDELLNWLSELWTLCRLFAPRPSRTPVGTLTRSAFFTRRRRGRGWYLRRNQLNSGSSCHDLHARAWPVFAATAASDLR